MNLVLSEVIKKVEAREDPPFRPDPPKLIDSEENPAIIDLMKICWSENPSERPDFDIIKKKLRVINKGR